MAENYPEKYRLIKTMFLSVCFISIVQFLVIAYMSGRMEFLETHIFDHHKRLLNIENRLGLKDVNNPLED